MLKRLLPIVPLLLTFAAAPALAQEDVPAAETTQQWIPLVLSLLLVLVVGAISFLSSRRGHQD